MSFTTPLAGANPARRTQTREFTLGTAALNDQNQTFVYVQADLAIPAATAAAVMSAGFHLTATTTGNYTADTAFAINDYGWVRKTTSSL